MTELFLLNVALLNYGEVCNMTLYTQLDLNLVCERENRVRENQLNVPEPN